MMLRSAEADPHVIERVVHRDAEAPWAAAQGRHGRGLHRGASLGRATEPPRGWLPLRSAPTPARRPKTSFEVRSGRSLGAAGSGSASRSPRRVDAGPSNPLQSSQLQGFAPLTSPLPSCRRCQQRDARSFHGLCSPPRSFVRRSGPTVPGSADALPGRSPEGAVPAARRGKPRWGTSSRDPSSSSPARCEPKPARAASSGAEAEPRASAFSAPSHDPGDATLRHRPAEAEQPTRAGARRSLSGARSSWSAFRDAAPFVPPPKRWPSECSPARPLHGPSWGS
jgi:hypothetical protein